MKNLVIVLLVVTTAVFGGWFFSQQKKTGLAESQVVELEAQLKKRQEADAKVVAKKEKQVKELRGRLNDTTAVAVEKSSQVSQLEQALTAAKTNSPVNGLAAMFKSPEMREMIKTQQKAVIGPMIDKTYSPLFQQLWRKYHEAKKARTGWSPTARARPAETPACGASRTGNTSWS